MWHVPQAFATFIVTVDQPASSRMAKVWPPIFGGSLMPWPRNGRSGHVALHAGVGHGGCVSGVFRKSKAKPDTVGAGKNIGLWPMMRAARAGFSSVFGVGYARVVAAHAYAPLARHCQGSAGIKCEGACDTQLVRIG